MQFPKENSQDCHQIHFNLYLKFQSNKVKNAMSETAKLKKYPENFEKKSDFKICNDWNMLTWTKIAWLNFLKFKRNKKRKCVKEVNWKFVSLYER